MKATLRYTLMGLTFAGLTFLSTSCRKDLCYDHDEHGLSVKVNLSSDWEQEWERTYAYDWEKLWEEDWKYDYEDLMPEGNIQRPTEYVSKSIPATDSV